MLPVPCQAAFVADRCLPDSFVIDHHAAEGKPLFQSAFLLFEAGAVLSQSGRVIFPPPPVLD